MIDLQREAAVSIASSQEIRSNFLEPLGSTRLSGYPKNPIATINRLIEVLDNQELEAAITRLEKGYGLHLVK